MLRRYGAGLNSQSVRLFVCICVPVSQAICLHLFICLSIGLSARLSVCLSVSLSVCLSCLSVCLPACRPAAAAVAVAGNVSLSSHFHLRRFLPSGYLSLLMNNCITTVSSDAQQADVPQTLERF